MYLRVQVVRVVVLPATKVRLHSVVSVDEHVARGVVPRAPVVVVDALLAAVRTHNHVSSDGARRWEYGRTSIANRGNILWATYQAAVVWAKRQHNLKQTSSGIAKKAKV